MVTVYKLRADHTVDFAAEELKKYLRMMVPTIPDIPIVYDPEAKGGFRLGLLEDFGLPTEGNPVLDDVVHIDADANGGILAGSNPRSVLFSVYRLLKLNGCRFLFPGADGEYIPRRQLETTKYHKMADHSHRGHTTEGDPSLEHVLDYIDYHAKQEMNVYGVYGVYNYHQRFYAHRHNEANRPPEPVDNETIAQWKVLCESELLKRGIRVQDGHHDWISKSLGMAENRARYKRGELEVPADVLPKLAQLTELGGKRGLRKGDINFTNLCMSNPEARRGFVDTIVSYVEKNRHLSCVTTSIADTSHNHCECAECRKKRPSDWHTMMLNEIDAKLTEKGIDTQLTFGAYIDTIFAPEVERLNNPNRFVFSYCPITRSYTSTVTPETEIPPTKPYIRNAWESPRTTEECFAYYKEWKKVFSGTCTTFEYHYWKPQFRDPGMMAITRRIYEDIYNLKPLGFSGLMEDGSNRSFFPNGFITHIYCATLMDRNLDYEAELEDYFSHIYGPDWKQAREYLEKISAAFNHKYMNAEMSTDPSKGRFYNPGHLASLRSVKKIAQEGRELAKAHFAMPTRPQTVMWRLLYRHTQWVEGIAEAFCLLCLGDNDGYLEKLTDFITKFGVHDFETERYFDLGLAANSLLSLKRLPAVELL